MNTHTTQRMHTNINSIQFSITFYIQAQKKKKEKKRCNESKQQISPFCSSLVSNSLKYTTASSAQRKNTKLDF